MTAGRRRPASRPSRRRCFLASRRVEPLSERASPSSPRSLAAPLVLLARVLLRGSRTRTTVLGGSSGAGSAPSLAGAAPTATPAPPGAALAGLLDSDSSWPAAVVRSSSSGSPPWPSGVGLVLAAGLAAAAPATATAATATARRPRRRLVLGRPRRPRPRAPSASAAGSSGRLLAAAPTRRCHHRVGGLEQHAGRLEGGGAARARRPPRRWWRARPRPSSAAFLPGAPCGLLRRLVRGARPVPGRRRAAPRRSSSRVAGGSRRRLRAGRVGAVPRLLRLGRALAAGAAGRCLRRSGRAAGGAATAWSRRVAVRVVVVVVAGATGPAPVGSVSSIRVNLPSCSRAMSGERSLEALSSSSAARELSLCPPARADGSRLGRAWPRAAADVRRAGSRRSGADVVPVRCQWIGHRAGLLVERPLRQPGHRGGHRRREVGHLTESGEDVVGSNGRCDVPHDQSKYRTRGQSGRRAAPARRPRSRRRTAARASKVRSPFLVSRLDLDTLGGEEGLHGRPPRSRRPPRAGAICHTEACSRSARLSPCGLDDLDTSRPGGRPRPAPSRSRSGSQRSRDGDLEVLRLAGRAGRRRAGVGDLRVRREPGRVGHRHGRAAQRPLEGPLEVAVAGEAQPAALGVVHPQALDGGQRAAGRVAAGRSRRCAHAAGPARGRS